MAEHIEHEDCQEEMEELVERYYKKTMHTLEILMNQLNMMYWWEKIRIMFVDKEPSITQIHKLMSRCLKLY